MNERFLRRHRPGGGRIAATLISLALATLAADVSLAASVDSNQRATLPAVTADASPAAWFPTSLSEDDVTIRPPARLIALGGPAASALNVSGAAASIREHTVIPLPPAALTGMAGLGTLAVVGWRRALARFVR
jgi:hypothetical protein